MYIKTPRQYRGIQRRRVFSCGRIFFTMIMLLLVIAGIGLIYNRAVFEDIAVNAVETAIADVGRWQSTQFAATPLPTRDPSRTLVDADNNWTRGRISLAMQSYSEVLEIVPNNVQVYSRMTEAYLTRGDISLALDFAEDTVTADPFSADAWATRSLAYSWEGNFSQGVASAQQALAIEPEHLQATAFLAYAYFQAGQSNLANIRANDAIDIDPNRWEGYWVRGLVRENDLLEIAEALEDFETAYRLTLELGQNPAMAGVVAGGVARVLVRPEYANYGRATAVLNATLEIDPNNVEALYRLGIVEFTYIGDYAEAQEVLLDCTEVAPTNYRCWYFLGRARNSQGDQDGALQAFEQAVELGTPLARHYWWAAEMQKNLYGDCTQAAIYLETGYSMVLPGGLDALDEGNDILIGDFEDSISICRVNVVPPVEVTDEADG
jgi:tetratricopeptide (TPR) repeat protein